MNPEVSLEEFARGLTGVIGARVKEALDKRDARLNQQNFALETLKNQIAILRADVAKLQAAKAKPKERAR